jgi:hypothetical protein
MDQGEKPSADELVSKDTPAHWHTITRGQRLVSEW